MNERNPFASIAGLVAVLALIAGLGMRFGMNSYVAGICIAAAVIGTWLLLAPQFETLETVSTDLRGQKRQDETMAEGASAFVADQVGATRERLRSTPRAAVGFSTTDPVAVPDSGSVQAVEDMAAPVQALGQLPLDAGALVVETDVNPASNVSGAFTLGHFEVRAASRRGSDHVILDDPRQDDYVVAKAANGRYLIVVVADGAAAAENAHFGSYWACRLLAQAIDRNLREGVPGIENMLSAARDELSELFDMRFTDGTKLRTIATTLVGLIAPVGGGPAAGFRIGNGDILVDGPAGWTSVFDEVATQDESALFPRSISAEVAPLDFATTSLLLATDGVSGPILSNESVAQDYSAALSSPTTEVEFDQLMSFPLEEARGDRTAVAVWFAPR